MNVLLLWSESIARGFAATTWITFRQALELGAHMRKEFGHFVEPQLPMILKHTSAKNPTARTISVATDVPSVEAMACGSQTRVAY
jgi:antirestriction protein ArdC